VWKVPQRDMTNWLRFTVNVHTAPSPRTDTTMVVAHRNKMDACCHVSRPHVSRPHGFAQCSADRHGDTRHEKLMLVRVPTATRVEYSHGCHCLWPRACSCCNAIGQLSATRWTHPHKKTRAAAQNAPLRPRQCSPTLQRAQPKYRGGRVPARDWNVVAECGLPLRGPEL
jgi:hypothetical protein